MFIFSFSPIKVFIEHRYVIFCLAPFLGVLSLFFLWIPLTWLRRLTIGFFIALALLANIVIISHRSKPGWQEMARILDRHIKKEDILLMTPPLFDNGYRYYSRINHPSVYFEDLILETQPVPRAVWHVLYKTTPDFEPLYPRLTMNFLNWNFPTRTIYSEKWYRIERHENVDFARLKKWYLAHYTWRREAILARSPVIFLPAEEAGGWVNTGKTSPLEMNARFELFRRLHTPPVKIPISQNLPAGDYILKMRLGMEDMPSSPTALSLIINDRPIKDWTLPMGRNHNLEARWTQTDSAHPPRSILQGSGLRPADYIKDNRDTRIILCQFYWLAIEKIDAEKLMTLALSPARSALEINPAEQGSPYLGLGWNAPEQWGSDAVISMNGGESEIFLPVENPAPLRIKIRAYPFHPEAAPPLHLKIKINDAELSSIPIKPNWNELIWNVDARHLKKGINELRLIPNRFILPADIEPDNKDTRLLSIWVKSLTIEQK